MADEPMTPHLAKIVLTILVAHAGFRDDRSFLPFQTRQFCREYRFQGALGFGGKLWRDSDGVMRVSCYREDETPDRLAMIEATNAALAAVSAPEGSETR